MWLWLGVDLAHHRKGTGSLPGDGSAPLCMWLIFCFAPCVAILGARVPADVAPHFLAFQGERQVERIISDSPRRVATAWMDQKHYAGRGVYQ